MAHHVINNEEDLRLMDAVERMREPAHSVCVTVAAWRELPNPRVLQAEGATIRVSDSDNDMWIIFACGGRDVLLQLDVRSAESLAAAINYHKARVVERREERERARRNEQNHRLQGQGKLDCQAGTDGDCEYDRCPQNNPATRTSWCVLDKRTDEEHADSRF